MGHGGGFTYLLSSLLKTCNNLSVKAMKTKFKNKTEVLTYELEGMYDAEKKWMAAFSEINPYISSHDLKKEMEKYAEQASEKRLKLKRIFSYLLSGPYKRKNKVIDAMLEECRNTLSASSDFETNTAMAYHFFKQMIEYKTCSYSIAKSQAIELELEPVADLLSEICAWEKEAHRSLMSALKKMQAKALIM
jgi:ferritin-like metal-binding protein YciE